MTNKIEYENYTDEEIEILEKLGGLVKTHKFWKCDNDKVLLTFLLNNDNVNEMQVCGISLDGFPLIMTVQDFLTHFTSITTESDVEEVKKEFKMFVGNLLTYINED